MNTSLMPTVQIMVDSPKEPPRGDFSTELAATSTAVTIGVEVDPSPIDVIVQGDTSQVFYDYNPDKATGNEIVEMDTLDEDEEQTAAERGVEAEALPAEDQQR
ncbi:sodium channel protein 60E-like [Drosophila miranda]|uniref:sodium channel protein 60E-like n=1 Tax=Drosophila miranda TaxID=7229 RepID=UPI00143F5FA0|nr:sodium channel protein 60E-like [Drosophila miranda]